MFSNIYEGKKVLITGDTGFKGSWLAIWLKKLNAEVYGYALPPDKDENNFVICELDKIVSHADGDVRELDTLVDYYNQVKPDITFHLAAQPLVLESYNNPHETFSTNIMGTVNFFEAVRKTPSIKVAINVTSDKCYKNNEWIWGYRENDRLGGKDPYSASKSSSEIITSSYITSFFLENNSANVASVRAGNVIGAGDWANNRIIPDYFRSKINKNQLIIRNPQSTRPWQHVLEPLSGYLDLAAKLYSEGKNCQGSWNFGPLDIMNRTVLELVEEIGNHDDIKNYDIGNSKNGPESTLLKLDISKAIRKLEWMPILNFQKTVKLTVKGYLSDISKKSPIENRLETLENYLKEAKSKKVKWSLN